MAARQIDLEEKWVCVPTLMIQDSFFELPVLVAPIVSATVVPTPVVSSPVATMDEYEEPILQDPVEPPPVAHEEEQQQLQEAPTNETLRRSQRVGLSAIPNDYEVYNLEEAQMEGNPTSFEEAIIHQSGLKP